MFYTISLGLGCYDIFYSKVIVLQIYFILLFKLKRILFLMLFVCQILYFSNFTAYYLKILINLTYIYKDYNNY